MSKKNIATDRLPGDLTKQELIDQIIRVDQAGEYGARRIYEGQLAVLGNSPAGEKIRHMYEQELEHLEHFDKEIGARGVRPTALQPLWHVAAYALGAGTALMGEKAAMACTVAVEEVIGEHYAEQAEALGDDEKELRQSISKFRDEELEHKDIAEEDGAREAPGYEVLSAGIKAASRLAIALSKRI